MYPENWVLDCCLKRTISNYWVVYSKGKTYFSVFQAFFTNSETPTLCSLPKGNGSVCTRARAGARLRPSCPPICFSKHRAQWIHILLHGWSSNTYSWHAMVQCSTLQVLYIRTVWWNRRLHYDIRYDSTKHTLPMKNWCICESVSASVKSEGRSHLARAQCLMYTQER